MARIMEERFLEKNASRILRKWAGAALGQINKRAGLRKVKKVGEKALKRNFFTLLI